MAYAAAAPDKPSTNDVPVTVISKILDVSTVHVQRLAKDGIIPKSEHGKYPLVPCVVAYIRYLRNQNVGGIRGGDVDDYQKERARNMKATAALTELKLAQTKGELIPAIDVENAWASVCSMIKTDLLSWPSRVTPLLTSQPEQHVIRSILEDAVNALLESMSRLSERAVVASDADTAEGGADIHADAQDDGE